METQDEEGWRFIVDESPYSAPYAQRPKTDAEWAALLEALSEPFPPEVVDFRPQQGEALAYVDARVVMDRLDAVVGAHNWTFEPVPLITDAKEVKLALGVLTVHGVTKKDFGEASNFHGSKGAASDALKRAAVHWGIGRYLYRVDGMPFSGSKISDAQKRQLRAKLPKPREYTPGEAPLYARDEPAPAQASATTAKAEPATRHEPPKQYRKVEPAGWAELLTAAKARGIPDKGAWLKLIRDNQDEEGRDSPERVAAVLSKMPITTAAS